VEEQRQPHEKPLEHCIVEMCPSECRRSSFKDVQALKNGLKKGELPLDLVNKLAQHKTYSCCPSLKSKTHAYVQKHLMPK